MLLKYCPICAKELKERIIEGKRRLACPNCSYIFWDNPTPVVAAILQYCDKIVLVRPNYLSKGRWALVAGYVEKGESAEQALIREIKEEINVKAKIVNFIGSYPIVKEGKNLLYIVFHAVVKDKEPKASSEISEVKLYKPQDALKILKGKTAGEALSDWLSKIRFGTNRANEHDLHN